MHTPEQAKNLWCPMVRSARREVKHKAAKHETNTSVAHVKEQIEVVGGCNTDTLGGNRAPASCCCIADRCAMWRWDQPAESVIRFRDMCADEHATVEPKRPPGLNTAWVFAPYDESDGEPACWVEPDHIALQRRQGHCGIAGRPDAQVFCATF